MSYNIRTMINKKIKTQNTIYVYLFSASDKS